MNLKISQNFSEFPWDPVIGLDSIQTVCLQLNPIGGSQGNPEKSREILKFTDLNRVNFREMAFNNIQRPHTAKDLAVDVYLCAKKNNFTNYNFIRPTDLLLGIVSNMPI